MKYRGNGDTRGVKVLRGIRQGLCFLPALFNFAANNLRRKLLKRVEN
jgi:hypothetical protein